MDLPGELDPGRAGADQGEGEPRPALLAGGQRLGHLERAKDPPADAQGVVDAFHPGGVGGELVVSEVGLLDPGGDEQIVVVNVQFGAVGPHRGDRAQGGVDAGGFGEQGGDVGVPAEQAPQRGGDLPF